MWLIHYTYKRNLDRIKDAHELRCALSLMNECQKKVYAEEKRSEPLECKAAVLRDQKPLTKRIQFNNGTTLAEFVEYLNKHVFFWPDRYAGKQARKRFRGKYPYSEGHIGLRCQLCDLIAENPKIEMLFSRYNSGSTPRRPEISPRCRELFQPLKTRNGRRLVEVVAHKKIRLPDNTEWECGEDKWRRFFV